MYSFLRYFLSAVLFSFLALGLPACGSDNAASGGSVPTAPDNNGGDTGAGNGGGNVDTGTWSIPANEVRDGGPGKDGIPSVDNPTFSQGWPSLNYMNDDDLVIIVKNDLTRAPRVFPHPILDWHEVVNADDISLTYCPLTGSAVIADRGQIGGAEFGVSGLLYQNNLIMYDRATDSNWSQMYMEAVRGPEKGSRISPLFYLETTLATARKMFPGGVDVLTTGTGYSKPYGSYPYDGYKTSQGLLFQMHVDGRRHPKDRVLGVLADNTRNAAARAYPISDAESGVEVINDVVGGKAVVVVRSGPDNFAVAFERFHPAHGELTFTADDPAESDVDVDIYPVNIRDEQTGTVWNLLGRAIDGELAGENLLSPEFMIAYWFAWAGFYSHTDIYQQ